ncbi:glycerol-3-phosphate acyltransferase 1, mitochondrial [Trichonephila clavipes]|nr:glycerol-3-phosphate acyltransferase 1, mitochondrial [Trichonephila clavipes]
MHHHTGPAPRIMVWGGIGYHSRTPLVRIAGILNSQRYISEIELLPWLARSPDLSPIENTWSVVAQRLTQITSPAATPYQLWQRVEAAWSVVHQEYIQSLFESMPRRVAVELRKVGCVAFDEMICDAKGEADEIDIPVEVTKRRNVNFDYETRDDQRRTSLIMADLIDNMQDVYKKWESKRPNFSSRGRRRDARFNSGNQSKGYNRNEYQDNDHLIYDRPADRRYKQRVKFPHFKLPKYEGLAQFKMAPCVVTVSKQRPFVGACCLKCLPMSRASVPDTSVFSLSVCNVLHIPHFQR